MRNVPSAASLLNPAVLQNIAASILLALSGISPSVHGQTLYVERFLSIDEAAGEIAIEVRLSGGLDSVVTVDCATEDIDAEAGRFQAQVISYSDQTVIIEASES